MATCPLQMCGQGDSTPRTPLRELYERCSASLGWRKQELWVTQMTWSEVWDKEALICTIGPHLDQDIMLNHLIQSRKDNVSDFSFRSVFSFKSHVIVFQ